MRRLYGVARSVCFDAGERRIGVAISDATGLLARPVGVISVSGLDVRAAQQAADEIARLNRLEQDQIDTVVIGLPRRLDGSANDMTGRVETFAAQLRERTGLHVVFQDERLSSREAESRLARRDKDWRTRKQRLDAAAAAIILQDYLDSHL